ncbi:MAG: protein phosphatase CheZ [Undibacterium sp.]|nr:protein phosphatase CheZ [Undibacterium sp.]
MTDSTDDLDALFEEMAAQQGTLASKPAEVKVVEEVKPVKESKSKKTDKASKSASSNSLASSSTDAADSKGMFNRLGVLVRTMHDSMRELGYDRSLTDVASQITDAQGRLEYVATLTEQAANKVLNATDQGIPEQDALGKTAKDVEARWDLLFAGKMSIEDFKLLAADSRTFASKAIVSTDAEKARLLDIMMAQDFQDLTGQLIKKVLIITQAVEKELTHILLDNAPIELKEKAIELMEGPSVPTTALEQDDVDNLLDSLGF